MPLIDPKRLPRVRRSAAIVVLAVGLLSVSACGTSSPEASTVTVVTEAPATTEDVALGTCDPGGYTDVPSPGCPAPAPGQGHDGPGGVAIPGGGTSYGEVPETP